MPIAKTTGKAGYMKIGTARVEVYKINPKFDPQLPESTDSSDFDVASDQLWETQMTAKLRGTIDFEGNFDLDSTNTAIIDLAISGVPFAAEVWVDATHKLYNGNWNMVSPDVDISIRDPAVVSIKAQLKSNGKITITTTALP